MQGQKRPLLSGISRWSSTERNNWHSSRSRETACLAVQFHIPTILRCNGARFKWIEVSTYRMVQIWSLRLSNRSFHSWTRWQCSQVLLVYLNGNIVWFVGANIREADNDSISSDRPQWNTLLTYIRYVLLATWFVKNKELFPLPDRGSMHEGIGKSLGLSHVSHSALKRFSDKVELMIESA